jgi:general secretion pathway protein C
MTRLLTFFLSARWSVIINIALAAVIGYHCMQLFLLLTSSDLTINNHQNRLRIKANQTQLLTTPILNISELLNAGLFGQNTSHIAMQIAKTPPETKLNFKLHGVYYSSNPHTSFAMIATAKNKSASYRVGDSLPSGAKLEQIKPKQVILLRNGRQETLTLVDTQNKISIRSQPDYAIAIPEKNYGNNSVSPEKLLGNYQRQLRTNPNKLMKLMRIYPVNQGGQLIGYRLRPGKDATLLSKFNLQSGDILTTVNGVKLDSPLKGLGMMQQLATTNHINLEVLRQGQVVSLSFNVEK